MSMGAGLGRWGRRVWLGTLALGAVAIVWTWATAALPGDLIFGLVLAWLVVLTAPVPGNWEEGQDDG